MTLVNMPKISIFIPTFNDKTDLLPCLVSINRLDYPKDKIEIVVWDNASKDGTAAAVKNVFSEMKNANWMGLKLIEWGKNEGTYIPYNLVQKDLDSESQYILGLDADVEISDNTLIELLKDAERDCVAVVGARSVYYDNPGLTSHGAGLVKQWTGFYGEKDSDKRIECDFVIGCCWLLNRDIFRLLGGFDPDYYISHWEVDYCLRAKKRGFRVFYEPNAIARHKISLQGPLKPERLYYLYRNKAKLIQKTFNEGQKPIAILLYFLFGLPKAVLRSVIRNKGFRKTEINLILRAFCDGFLNKSGKAF